MPYNAELTNKVMYLGVGFWLVSAQDCEAIASKNIIITTRSPLTPRRLGGKSTQIPPFKREINSKSPF